MFKTPSLSLSSPLIPNIIPTEWLGSKHHLSLSLSLSLSVSLCRSDLTVAVDWAFDLSACPSSCQVDDLFHSYYLAIFFLLLNFSLSLNFIFNITTGNCNCFGDADICKCWQVIWPLAENLLVSTNMSLCRDIHNTRELLLRNSLSSLIYPLTARVVWAPWLRNQFSPFSPVLHCPLGLGELQACPFPDVVFPPLPLSALSSSPFHCTLQDGPGLTWWTGDMTIPLQFASLCNDQEVFVWSDCLLDLGTEFLVGNMIFAWDA